MNNWQQKNYPWHAAKPSTCLQQILLRDRVVAVGRFIFLFHVIFKLIIIPDEALDTLAQVHAINTWRNRRMSSRVSCVTPWNMCALETHQSNRLEFLRLLKTTWGLAKTYKQMHELHSHVYTHLLKQV